MTKGLQRLNFLIERNEMQKKWSALKEFALELLTAVMMIGSALLLILFFWVLM